MRRFVGRILILPFFLLCAQAAQAGHLFTQSSSNTPTWIQEGKGIAITQYGDEGGGGAGSYSINFEQPSGGVPAEATQGDPQWWQWSSGDVMRITIPLADATYTRTIAYDADAACAYDECGVTGTGTVSGTWSDLGGAGVTLPAHSGEKASYDGSDVGFDWTIVSLAGEFAIGGYRFYTTGGTIDGTGAGPLDQSSVVDAGDLPGGGGGSRDITNSDETQGGLGSSTTYAFDGGTLTVTSDESADFEIKAGGGGIAVGSGESHELSGNLSDASGVSGAFEKSGDGTLILSGTNTHSGGTTVSGGRLQVAADSALGGAGAGLTLDGGSLGITGDITTTRTVSIGAGGGTIDVDAARTFGTSGGVTGTGPLAKTGDGELRLGGASGVGGAISVQAGGLSVEGSLSAAAMSVLGDARLSGSGTVSAPVTVQGTIAPGSSPGTMTVAGDVTLTPVSNFEAEIDGRGYDSTGGAGTYDRLVLTGATSVFTADGSLRPILRGITAPATDSFSPVLGDRFRIVTTENSAGITGEFADFDAAPTGLDPRLRFDVEYGGAFIDLVIVPLSYAGLVPARNRNIRNVAAALDGIRPAATSGGSSDRALLFSGLRGLGEAATVTALGQISGQVHAFALADAADLAHGMLAHVPGLDNGRPAGGRALWTVMGGTALHFGSDGRADSYDSTHGHIWAGIDLLADRDHRAGLAIGHGTARLDAGVQGDADIRTAMLTGFAMRRAGRAEFSAKLAYGAADLDVERSVALATGAQVQRSEAEAEMIALELAAGMRHALPRGLSGRSSIALSREWVSVDAYREQGSSVTALTFGAEDFQATRLRAGYEVGRSMGNDRGAWRAGAALIRNFGDTATRDAQLAGTAWTVSSPDRRDTALEVNAGVTLRTSARARLDLDLAHVASGDRRRSSASLSYRLEF